MTQAGVPAPSAGPESEPAGPAGPDAAPASTPLRIGVPLLLAAGWGALLTFSAMFLMEDGRSAAHSTARVAEAGSFEPARGSGPRASDRVGEGAVHLVVAADPAPAAIPAVVSTTAAAPARQSADRGRERPDYVGTWGPTARACGNRRRHGYLPARITEDEARAGRTLCRFRDGRRDGIAWALAAECSERGRRWTSQVRLLVDGDRLTWTSAKGAASYVRCARRDG